MVEVIVVVGVVAVLAAVLIPVMTNVFGASKGGIAAANLEQLNQAVLKHNHAVKELTNSPDSSSISDEQEVMTTLQVRDAAIPGTPFLSPSLTASASSDINSYRASWNGRMFEIVSPPTAGTGVDLAKFHGE